jgi:hypothetical protein
LDERIGEAVKVEGEHVEETNTKPGKCNYCILKIMKKYIFHPGSIYLYVKDEELTVLADMDHVYQNIERG